MERRTEEEVSMEASEFMDTKRKIKVQVHVSLERPRVVEIWLLCLVCLCLFSHCRLGTDRFARLSISL